MSLLAENEVLPAGLQLKFRCDGPWTTGGRSIANRPRLDVGIHNRTLPAASLASWRLRPHVDRPSCIPFPWGRGSDTRLGQLGSIGQSWVGLCVSVH